MQIQPQKYFQPGGFGLKFREKKLHGQFPKVVDRDAKPRRVDVGEVIYST